MKRKLTDEQREERLAYRAKAREKRAARRSERRSLLQDLAARAQDRIRRRDRADREARVGHRGVDRLPAAIRYAPTVTVEEYVPDPDHRKGPRQVDTTEGTSVLPDGRTVHGNYRERRAAGARGRQRPPRRRELTAHAVNQLTLAERKHLAGEVKAAAEADNPMSDREIRGRAWQIMRDRAGGAAVPS